MAETLLLRKQAFGKSRPWMRDTLKEMACNRCGV
jgi:hypothetical protein